MHVALAVQWVSNLLHDHPTVLVCIVFLDIYFILYIHVTVHRNKFLFNNQINASIIQINSVIKLYVFRASSLPIIRSFLLELCPILTLLGSGRQTCMKLTNAERTVENS